MSCGLDQSCGMNAQTCEMEQTCSAPMHCETSCAPAPTHCEAAPCQQSYTMPCNYNECGEEEETCEQRTGFRQSVRNMFRRHSESSCSEQGYECDYRVVLSFVIWNYICWPENHQNWPFWPKNDFFWSENRPYLDPKTHFYPRKDLKQAFSPKFRN